MNLRRTSLTLLLLGAPLSLVLGDPLAPPPKPKGAAPAKPPATKPKPRPVAPVPPKPVIEHPKGMDDTRIYYQHDLALYDTQTERLSMQGNVIFEYKDTVFKSQKVLYNRPERIASSPVAVQLDDSQNTITGDKGTAYYKRTTANIEGNVKIVARPDQTAKAGASTKSLRKDFDSPVTITSRTVTYNWKTRIAIPAGDIKISFTLKNKKGPKLWTVVSDTMEYNGKTETVYLRGNVQGTTKEGDRINGETATVILKNGQERMEVSMSKNNRLNYDDVKEDGEDEKKAETAPPPTTGRTGGTDTVIEG
jgi:lipopolysaccharide assembly outer membrane protein LptD (OstA)